MHLTPPSQSVRQQPFSQKGTERAEWHSKPIHGQTQGFWRNCLPLAEQAWSRPVTDACLGDSISRPPSRPEACTQANIPVQQGVPQRPKRLSAVSCLSHRASSLGT